MPDGNSDHPLPKLKPRYKRLADLWLQGKSGSQAAREMGYKGDRPDQFAYRILRMPEVKAYIAERRKNEEEAFDVNKASVIRRLYLASSLEVTSKDLMKDGRVLSPDELPDEIAALVTRFEVEELFEGQGENRRAVGHRYKYWMQCPNKAAETLGRFLGWNRDQLEVAHLNAPPPVINIIAYDDDDEAEQRARAAVSRK